MGGRLADALRAAWLPKITSGWFFRAESFFSVARYLDAVALESHGAPPDFLSHSHGEGFLRFFEERVIGRAFSYSTSRSRPYRHRGKLLSSSCFGAWRAPASARS
jgi:predicted ATPase